jgi:hypothetical protein
MLSRVVRTFALVLVAVLSLSSAIWAQSIAVTTLNPATQTLTITLKGMIGPILSGSDPLGLNGLSGTVTIMAKESLSPIKHTSTSATYRLPAGAIKVTAGSNHFATKSPSKMIINLLSSADTMTLQVAGPDGLQVVDTTYLQAGSWSSAVLKHPTVFTPSPQKLTSAKTANGPGCKIKYTIFSETTVLGFSGTGSNKSGAGSLRFTHEPDHWEF